VTNRDRAIDFDTGNLPCRVETDGACEGDGGRWIDPKSDAAGTVLHSGRREHDEVREKPVLVLADPGLAQETSRPPSRRPSRAPGTGRFLFRARAK